jgi:hypothetical protein
MRKILTPVILFILLCFCFACKKSGNDASQASITGKWNLQKFTSTQYYNGNAIIDTIPLAPVTATIEFTDRGTFVDTYSSQGGIDTTDGSYSLSGKMLTFSNYHSRHYNPDEPIPTPLSLFFGGFLGSASTVTSEITQLTTNQMVVHAVITEPVNSTDIWKEVVDEYYVR